MLVLFETVKTKVNGMLWFAFLCKISPWIFMPPGMWHHHYWWISKSATICTVEFDLPGHI